VDFSSVADQIGSQKDKTMISRAVSRSRTSLARWASSLLRRWSVLRDEDRVDFHTVVWLHDESCALHAEADPVADSSSRCRCEPNAVLVINPGTPAQRQIVVVLGGTEVPLPVSGAAERPH
jgi:hypothetical protein